MHLCDDISAFLTTEGIRHDIEVVDNHSLIYAYPHQGNPIVLIPVDIQAQTSQQAGFDASSLEHMAESICARTDGRPVMIAEDRWRYSSMIRARILAHLKVFTQIYARNCEVRKIDRQTAADFLRVNHSYGDASCRYRYGLYLKRHTGHNAASTNHIGELIAVATFSNARKWIKSDRVIRSYEWTRYASLPGLRISGGMGKLLNAFIEEVNPDDIMTYADMEWSDGKVYERLGFSLEGRKEPVTFLIDTVNWKRKAITKTEHHQDLEAQYRYFQNSGSNKYRLKLTDYQ